MTFVRALFLTLAVLLAVTTARVINHDTSSSEENDDDDLELINEFRSICLNKTGSNETFERMVQSAQNAAICFSGKIDSIELAKDVENLTSSTRVEFFTTYCPQLRDTLSCLTPLTDEFRKCVDGEDLEILDIFINLLPEAIGLVCKNHGELWFGDIIENQCMPKMVDYTEDCLKGALSNATFTMDTTSYGQKQCDEFVEVRQCLVTKLNGCKSPKLIDLFDLFYRPLMKSTNCKHYVVLDEIPTIDSNDI